MNFEQNKDITKNVNFVVFSQNYVKKHLNFETGFLHIENDVLAIISLGTSLLTRAQAIHFNTWSRYPLLVTGDFQISILLQVN